MATTSTDAARYLLRQMDSLGVPYGLLHNASSVAAGAPISDVDTAVGISPWEVLQLLATVQERLVPIMTWQYDVGAVTTFWMSPNGAEGVQLDLLHDPEGRGRYGFRTGAALNYRSHAPDWPPRLSDEASLVYLASKRLTKGNQPVAETIMRTLTRHETWQLTARALLSPRSLRRVVAASAGRYPPAGAARWSLVANRLNRRGLSRIVEPCGHRLCVDAANQEAAIVAQENLSRVLVKVVWRNKVPAFAQRTWDLIQTRRPTLIVYNSMASKSTIPLADSGLDLSSIIIGSLSQTTRERISANTRLPGL